MPNLAFQIDLASRYSLSWFPLQWMEIDTSREPIHPYGQSTPKADWMKSTLELPICSDGELNPPPIIHIAEDCSLTAAVPLF